MAFQTAGNDSRHGLIAVAHKYLFAVANELNMGAELSFQIADIDSSHAAIIADVTMLVICYLSSGMQGAKGTSFDWGQQNFCELGADSEGCRGAYPRRDCLCGFAAR
jgi:glycerate kinase